MFPRISRVVLLLPLALFAQTSAGAVAWLGPAQMKPPRSNSPLASSDSPAFFREVRRFPLRRIAPALASLPVFMLGLLIWQVLLGHSWGKRPMSNGDVIGWTIFL
jgi:hypothetical protein